MNPILDPLDIPAGECETPPTAPFPFKGTLPKGQIFTEQSFFNWLNKANKTKLWVMTFSATPLCELELPVTRLILHLGEFPASKTKRMAQIHTKLYLQFDKNSKHIASYIGSQNLVASTNANLTVKLDVSLNKFCKGYFLHYWNQA